MNSKIKTNAGVVIFIAMFCLAALAMAKGPGGGQGPNPEPPDLDVNEQTHLLFMRAEEKLAHDVYVVLGDKYPDYAFDNIVKSETKHANVMVDQLLSFDLEDPNKDDGPGEFNDANYGAYFTEKYTYLTGQGKKGLLEALMVGALIEELDMYDIRWCPHAIVDLVEGDIFEAKEDCGMEYTEVATLEESYQNLLEGSENHLRAFVRQIESSFPYMAPYEAQYLEQSEVDAILGR